VAIAVIFPLTGQRVIEGSLRQWFIFEQKNQYLG